LLPGVIGMEEDDDYDDDSILTPAGTVRVIIGLVMMVFGVFVAALTDKKLVGLLLFILSPLVMVLARPANKK
jgi:ABC-type multidrug transport system fused ATPase/permease subunit